MSVWHSSQDADTLPGLVNDYEIPGRATLTEWPSPPTGALRLLFVDRCRDGGPRHGTVVVDLADEGDVRHSLFFDNFLGRLCFGSDPDDPNSAFIQKGSPLQHELFSLLSNLVWPPRRGRTAQGLPRARANLGLALMDLGNDADELALALRLGLATAEEAIAWTDAAIIALDEPPYALIEASCAGRAPLEHLAHLLGAAPGQRDPQLVAQRVLRRIAIALRGGSVLPARAAGQLYGLLLLGYSPGTELEGEIYRLEDAFSLTAQGVWGSVEDATRELQEFLAPYLPSD